MKNWIEWTNKISKIWQKFERERTSNFCILWADCEQIVSDKAEENLNKVGKLLTMWHKQI